MGRPPGWVTQKTGRAPMPSPGRPGVSSREQRARFWLLIAQGLSSEQAATSVGVSMPVGSRWFRHAGGMTPMSLAPMSGRYLSFAEREEIAILKGRGDGVRAIARQLGRHPSTISRELRRNAASRGGRLDYRASVARWHSELRARRPKPCKLAGNDRLREYIQQRLSGAVARPDGASVSGPTVRWIGRRHGPR
jgi:transposase